MIRMMRITFLFFLSAVFFLTSCQSTSSMLSATEDYNENIIFTIDKVQQEASISTGNGFWKAAKGGKFVFISMTFTNKSSEKQDVNFENIVLLDMEDKAKYKPEFSMMPGPVNIWGQIDSSINAKASKSRKLVFNFPMESEPEFILVNNKMIKLIYKK